MTRVSKVGFASPPGGKKKVKLNFFLYVPLKLCPNKITSKSHGHKTTTMNEVNNIILP